MLLSWFPLMGSEFKSYFDKQGDINPASLLTRSSIKRQHRLCFDYGDELLGAKRFVSAELEDNSVEHALSFDAPVLLSLDESVFADNDEEDALTSDSIHGHDFLEPDAGLDEEAPSLMFDECVIFQAPTETTDMTIHDSTPSDETAPKENESLELALSNEKVWKKISYNSYTCIPCDITISFSSQLSAHIRSHKHRRALGLPKLEWNQRKYTCEICKVCWDYPDAFKKHEGCEKHRKAVGLPELGWNQRKHICVACRVGFDRPDALKIHKSSNIHKKKLRAANR